MRDDSSAFAILFVHALFWGAILWGRISCLRKHLKPRQSMLRNQLRYPYIPATLNHNFFQTQTLLFSTFLCKLTPTFLKNVGSLKMEWRFSGFLTWMEFFAVLLTLFCPPWSVPQPVNLYPALPLPPWALWTPTPASFALPLSIPLFIFWLVPSLAWPPGLRVLARIFLVVVLNSLFILKWILFWEILFVI